MRKIELMMNHAITHCKNWNCDNTSVSYDEENDVNKVYLHGNKIAEIGSTWLRLYDGGWRTNTTKSRLSAILRAHGNGETIFQKKGKWYIDTKVNVTEFEDGMMLQ
jgi:hypothetical protein